MQRESNCSNEAGSPQDLSDNQESLKPIEPFISEAAAMDTNFEDEFDISKDIFEDSFLDEDEDQNEDSLSMLRDRTFYDIDHEYQEMNFPDMESLPDREDDDDIDLETQLANMVCYWLDREMFPTAIFVAERLVYQNKSNPNSWFLLGLSYYKANKVKSAHVLLKDLPKKYLDNNGLFLLGRIALKVKDYRLAEDIFTSLLDLPLPDMLPLAKLAESKRCYAPDKCSVLIFLAETLRSTFRNVEALKLYEKAWIINPFSWEAFEKICLLASKPPSHKTIEENFQTRDRNSTCAHLLEAAYKRSKFNSITCLKDISDAPEMLFSSTYDHILPSYSGTSPFFLNKDRISRSQEHSAFNTDGVLPKEPKRTFVFRDSSAQGLVLEPHDDSSSKRTYDQTKDPLPMKKLNVMFMEFSLCQALMAKIDPIAALESLSRLSYSQSSSPWVQCARGRMHLEAINFKEAKEAFTEARNEAPYLTSSMGYFSTALWQLRDEQRIAQLASDLHDLEPMGYDTMIAAGNAYSLQSWPERAIQVFQAASKAEPLSFYAYTLAGHELSGVKKGELAAKMFRKALQVNPRAYSALVGLGNMALGTNMYRNAIFYFNKALEIQPTNALVKERLGTAYIKYGDFESGLILYDEAIYLSPSKHALKFQKARVLIAIGKFKEALEILLALKRSHLQDSALHFTLGKLHFLMDNSLDAYIHLRWAADLMPSLSGKVHDIIRLYEKGELKDLSPEACCRIVFDASEITLSKL